MRYEDLGLASMPKNPLSDYVQTRIREAADNFVRIADWQAAASKHIARLTGADAGIVLACPAAAFMLLASYYLADGGSKCFYLPETIHVDENGIKLCGGVLTNDPEMAVAMLTSADDILNGRFHAKSGLPIIALCTRVYTVGELRIIARTTAALIIPGILIRGPERSTAVACGYDIYSYLLENSAPHYGLGRSAKIGKEEIAGLAAAAEEYVRGVFL